MQHLQKTRGTSFQPISFSLLPLPAVRRFRPSNVSTFRRSDMPTFQRTLHSLLSLFEQRVFENPFEIRRFRTLSKNSRVCGIASHSGTRFFTSHQSRTCSDLVGVISPATLFHPWHANASANTSLPISIGAKRLRAPFAFRRIPPLHFPETTSIAGSKLAPAMVKSPSTFLPLALPSTPLKSIRRSSRGFAASQNNSPISMLSLPTFSKRTSPPSLPPAASASP